MSFIISNFNLFFGLIRSNLLFFLVSPENEIKPYIENSFCSSVVKVGLMKLSKSYRKKFSYACVSDFKFTFSESLLI